MAVGVTLKKVNKTRLQQKKRGQGVRKGLWVVLKETHFLLLHENDHDVHWTQKFQLNWRENQELTQEEVARALCEEARKFAEIILTSQFNERSRTTIGLICWYIYLYSFWENKERDEN